MSILNSAALVIDHSIFQPKVGEDSYKNPISKILFPDFTYNMVHHPSKSWKIESANIFAGRDKFVRVSARYTDIDTQEESVTIITNIGDFSIHYGDGDVLAYNYPETLKADKDICESLEYAAIQLRKLGQSNDAEASFLLYTIGVIHTFQYHDLFKDMWMNKEIWEAKKAQLIAERSQFTSLPRRRYSNV